MSLKELPFTLLHLGNSWTMSNPNYILNKLCFILIKEVKLCETKCMLAKYEANSDLFIFIHHKMF